MRIPDSPEQLFELLSEPTLREFFPTFDELPPLHQRLVRVIHLELTKGELTDRTFQQIVRFVVLLWRGLNLSVLESNDERIESHSVLDESWVANAAEYHRMDQFLSGLQAVLDTMPPEGDAPDDELHGSRYVPDYST